MGKRINVLEGRTVFSPVKNVDPISILIGRMATRFFSLVKKMYFRFAHNMAAAFAWEGAKGILGFYIKKGVFSNEKHETEKML